MIKIFYDIFNSMDNLHSCFVIETLFHWIITKLIMCFHVFYLLPFVHIIPIEYLHNHTNLYNLWFMKEKKK